MGMDSVNVTITSNQLTFETEALSWREHLTCKVAKRKVGLRSEGTVIDNGTYLKSAEKINITLRLDDSELYVLNDIYYSSKTFTITINESNSIWLYKVKMKNKPLMYEYNIINSNVKKWICMLELLLVSEKSGFPYIFPFKLS